jgi:hypothetical protein
LAGLFDCLLAVDWFVEVHWFLQGLRGDSMIYILLFAGLAYIGLIAVGWFVVYLLVYLFRER